MDLQRLGDGVWALPGAVCSVVIEGEGGALLVDTGVDAAHARRLLRAVAALGLTPAGILNTHSHADHHGGNAFVLERFAVPVWAPPLEAAVINFPLLEPISLYGAMPPAELRGKFLLAPASPARPLDAGPQRLCGRDLELLPVPGHAAQMHAVRLGGVLYAADALFGPAALHKHPLTFCVDSAAQKASARALGGLSGVNTVQPGHGKATPELEDLVTQNLVAYARTTDAVRAALTGEPQGTGAVLARTAAALGATHVTPAAAALNRAVVAAHLAELCAAGEAALTATPTGLAFVRA